MCSSQSETLAAEKNLSLFAELENIRELKLYIYNSIFQTMRKTFQKKKKKINSLVGSIYKQLRQCCTKNALHQYLVLHSTAFNLSKKSRVGQRELETIILWRLLYHQHYLSIKCWIHLRQNRKSQQLSW